MQAKYGTGTVSKKNGKWVWVGYYKDESGKIKRPTKSFNTETEALLFQAGQLSKSQINKELKSEDVTLDTVFQSWLKEGNAAETSKRTILYNYNNHIKDILGECKIKHLKVVSFSDYLKKLAVSEKTKYNIYTDLKTIIKYAIEKKIIFENPLEEMDFIPKQRTRKRIVNTMSIDEYSQIMLNKKNMKSFYYNTILFLGETGLRVSELAIKETDIEKIPFKDGETQEEVWRVYLDKTVKRTLNDDYKTTKLEIVQEMKTSGSEREIYLNGFAIHALEAQMEWKKKNHIISPFIFTSSTGTLLDQRCVLRALHMFCENAGIKKRGLHSLRKCYINRTLQNGIQPFDLAKQTGHSMQTMFKYYHNLDIKTGLKIIEASEYR